MNLNLGKILNSQRTLIMGVVNITPDSFSDGGKYLEPRTAVEKALALVADGADIIDFGAESTRPGAESVGLEEEWRRLAPVLEAIVSEYRDSVVPSLDSSKPEIMRRAIDLGVPIINDVRALADRDTLDRLNRNAGVYIAMHMHESPKTMQRDPLDWQEALRQVEAFYRLTQQRLLDIGFAKDRIWLDPGIGFGKTDRANLHLMKQALGLCSDLPIVLGVSRKSFMGRLLGIELPQDRDPASKMLELGLIMGGVRAIRTHDVKTLGRIRDLLGDS